MGRRKEQERRSTLCFLAGVRRPLPGSLGQALAVLPDLACGCHLLVTSDPTLLLAPGTWGASCCSSYTVCFSVLYLSFSPTNTISTNPVRLGRLLLFRRIGPLEHSTGQLPVAVAQNPRSFPSKSIPVPASLKLTTKNTLNLGQMPGLTRQTTIEYGRKMSRACPT